MGDKKALILGAHGQLGRCLAAAAPDDVMVTALGSNDLDIRDRAAVGRFIRNLAPDLVFNAAAYTAVDRAEQEEAIAHAVNATAVGHIAEAAADAGATLIHVSTDFVFDGASATPYAPDDPTNPLCAYGRTKRAGELLAGDAALVVRTAWLYGPDGANFVRTMVRLMAERPEVRVVADQVGSPTYAPDLAAALWRLSALGVTGVHHYTDAGTASWYDFAVAIRDEALAVGILARGVPVIPIDTASFPTPARRPAYSVLDKGSTWAALGEPSSHWRANLRRMMTEIGTHG
ncbi:dTDP-4-dehydrorhamnose reductase [Sphingomonas sp. VDB2]|uniref:dTDP-4-dehydrorhamnose reductase n=1 Tax=Sphingomonas sp. VDB2 TaxID=3228751 RepID=UPI003A803756